MKRLAFAALALVLLRADMYQDMSNAVGGKRAGTFYAQAFGSCTWNATSDVGACINQAIEAAYAAGGGTVAIPAGTYGISTPIQTTRDNIGIACAAPSGAKAASVPYNVPPPAESGGCELKWIGTAGGRIVAFHGSDAAFLLGAKVENIKFNGNAGLAADGLYLRSVYGGSFNNLRFVGGFNGGKIVHLDVAAGEHATPHGVQMNRFTELGVYNTGHTSTGLFLGYYQSATGAGANASINYFENTHIYTSGKGIHCRGCDNNIFHATSLAVAAGNTGVDLDIYNDNGRWFPAIGNVFWSIRGPQSASPILGRGQTTYPTCAAFGFPTYGNCTWGNAFYAIDGSNGTAPPQIEPGAYLEYEFDYGIGVNASGAVLASDGMRPAQTVMGGYGGVGVCGNDGIAYGAGVGTHYCGATQLFSNAATDRFTIGLNGPNLTWVRSAGTGSFEFTGAPVRTIGIQVPTMPVSCTGQPAGTLWNNTGVVNICP